MRRGRAGARALLALGMMLLGDAAFARAPAPRAASQSVAVYTPAPGNAERTAILDALRGADGQNLRFRVDTLRVHRSAIGAVAYVVATPSRDQFDGGEYIVERRGGGPWRRVWADTGGGSGSCAAGARYFNWAIALFTRHGVAADAMVPGITAQARQFAKAAQRDPDLQCVGDLSGGPDG